MSTPSFARCPPAIRLKKAGVRVGDVIRAVDGQRVAFAGDLAEAISKKAGVEIDLTIYRDNVERHIRVTPIERQGGKIGISPAIPTRKVQSSCRRRS
jgi:S1-C subfamily serine protease